MRFRAYGFGAPEQWTLNPNGAGTKAGQGLEIGRPDERGGGLSAATGTGRGSLVGPGVRDLTGSSAAMGTSYFRADVLDGC